MAKQNDNAGAEGTASTESTGGAGAVPTGIQGSGLAGANIAQRAPVTMGRTVRITDHETGKQHPAIVTHANDDSSIIATIFKPNETVAGVGFLYAEGNLASPGRWHWPT